jgi:hypothetical protein
VQGSLPILVSSGYSVLSWLHLKHFSLFLFSPRRPSPPSILPLLTTRHPASRSRIRHARYRRDLHYPSPRLPTRETDTHSSQFRTGSDFIPASFGHIALESLHMGGRHPAETACHRSESSLDDKDPALSRKPPKRKPVHTTKHLGTLLPPAFAHAFHLATADHAASAKSSAKRHLGEQCQGFHGCADFSGLGCHWYMYRIRSWSWLEWDAQETRAGITS